MLSSAVNHSRRLTGVCSSNFGKMFYSTHRGDECLKKYVALKQYTKYNRSFIRNSSTISPGELKQHRGFTNEEQEEIMQYFPTIVRDLTAIEDEAGLDDRSKRFAKVLEYNIRNGSKNTGLLMVLTYKMLEKPEELTKENIKLAYILAWCYELQITSSLMVDDIMDNSETRRNSLCWYRLPSVGLTAINDAAFIGQGVFILLKKYFSAHPYYISMVELMNETYFKVAFGESLELENLKLEDITMERLTVTDRYTFVIQGLLGPITLGMCLSRVYREELISQCKDVILEMGHFLANQNDMLDVFADPSTTGKIGNDIREGKCTWLAVKALQKANCRQRKIMEDHYGKRETKSVELIVDLFRELEIPQDFFECKAKSYDKVCQGIKRIPNDPLRKLFLLVSKKVYTPS